MSSTLQLQLQANIADARRLQAELTTLISGVNSAAASAAAGAQRTLLSNAANAAIRMQSDITNKLTTAWSDVNSEVQKLSGETAQYMGRETLAALKLASQGQIDINNKAFDSRMKQMAEAFNQQKNIEKKMLESIKTRLAEEQAAITSGNTAALDAIKAKYEEEERRLETLAKIESERSKQLVEDMQKEATAIKEAMKKSTDPLGDAKGKIDGMVEGVSNIGEEIKKGNWGGGLAGIGAGLQQASLRAKGQLAEKEAKGESTGGAGGFMLKMMAGLGAIAGVVTVLGGLASVFGSLFNAVKSANNAMVDANKEILKGASAADLGAKSAGDLAEKLRTIREVSTDFGFLNQWGIDSKEFVEILNKFSETGITYEKLAKGAKDAAEAQLKYKEAVEAVLIVSRNLGKSTEEVTKDMGQYMLDYKATLESVQDSFLGIAKAAQISGFGTSRFYSMVINATSGMTLYNHRITETANILLKLGKVLGASRVDAFAKTLASKYQSENMQAKWKEVLLTGGAGKGSRVQQIYAKSAQAQSAEVVKSLGLDKLVPVLSKIGVSGITEANFAEKLSRLTAEQQGKLFVEAQAALGEAQGRQLDALVDLTKGMTGDFHDMAQMLPKLDLSGKLAMQFGMIKERLDGKELSELKGTELAYAEQLLGISGDTLQEFITVNRQMTGAFKILQDIAATGGGVAAGTKEADEMFKKYGAMVTKEGKIVGEDQKEITNAIDLLVTTNKDLAKAFAEPKTREEMLAEQIGRSTTNIDKVIDNVIATGIQKIAGYTEFVPKIFNTLFGTGESEEAKGWRLEAFEKVGKDIEIVQAEIERISGLEKRSAADEARLKELKQSLPLLMETQRQTSKIAQGTFGNVGQVLSSARGAAATQLGLGEKATGEDLQKAREIQAERQAKAISEYLKWQTSRGGLAASGDSKLKELGIGEGADSATIKKALLEDPTKLTAIQQVIDKYSSGSVSQKREKQQEFGFDTQAFSEKTLKAVAGLQGAGSQDIITQLHEQTKQAEAQQKAEKKIMTSITGTDSSAVANAKAYFKEEKNARGGEMVKMLEGAGFTELASQMQMIGQDTTGTAQFDLSKLSEVEKGLLAGFGETGSLAPWSIQLGSKIASAKAGKDFLMQFDSSGKPVWTKNIDPQDTAVFSKPGGALQSAAGATTGGGTVGGGIVMHFHGTPKENYEMVKRVLREARLIPS